MLLARRRFCAAQMNLAQQAWEAGNAAQVLALLESQRPRLDQDDLRSFTLPPTVDEKKVDAKLNDGMLSIMLNKREESKPRRISVA